MFMRALLLAAALIVGLPGAAPILAQSAWDEVSGGDPNGNLVQVVDANGNATPTAGDGATTGAIQWTTTPLVMYYVIPLNNKC